MDKLTVRLQEISQWRSDNEEGAASSVENERKSTSPTADISPLQQQIVAEFQRCSNLRSLVSHGESGDADQAIDRELPKLRREIAGFKKDDVFNCDEFGHFYCMAPDRTIAHERMPGRKKQKVCLTYIACCNATGT